MFTPSLMLLSKTSSTTLLGPDLNRRKQRERRFSFPSPLPLFAPVPSSSANARACLLALARLVFLSATAWVAMAEVLFTLFICGRLDSGRGSRKSRTRDGPSPSGCESARPFTPCGAWSGDSRSDARKVFGVCGRRQKGGQYCDRVRRTTGL